MSRKLVYVASPFSKVPNKELAMELAENACDEVALRGFYPVSPVLLWAGRISENTAEERLKNLNASAELLKMCDFIYVSRNKYSADSIGIQNELKLAKELNINELK